MNETDRKSREKRYREKYLPAYQAFISVYPFDVEDLEGEIWKDIEGSGGKYQQSNYGRTKTLKKGKIKILKPLLHETGYLRVHLEIDGKHKYFFVHILVAKLFIPNPENKTQVNHRFGCKLSCHVDSLEWTTPFENMQHAFKTGLQKSGTEHSNSKLTEEQVREIRKTYIKGDKKFGACALGKKFNVSYNTILSVVKGRYYKNVK